ncbi:hypothetical protein BGZ96_001184 [Linnemannia gamsii]|uniref:P-loop containing nucleoside triphosphate hydrolase protein n=1 Tax=Linnemannia gamsii TaxID=64522 RepID=A0ABQ7JMM7_9FUNG|nr:hypothetical protein BGZ96_001184 [Linnemannia gamsii]
MAAMTMMSPTSPMSPTSGQFPEGSSGDDDDGGGTAATGSLSKRNSIASSIVQERIDYNRINPLEGSSDNNKADPNLPPLSSSALSSPASPSSPSTTAALPPAPPPLATPISTACSNTAVATATYSAAVSTSGSDGNDNSGDGSAASEMETPRLHKRRSFAQSLKHGMLSLTQLLSPSSSVASSRLPSPMTNAPDSASSSTTATTGAAMTGPPHYNILVLGSDSAPLASTLYKMSGLLPSATKIRHYQEISGFFVAYFRSNGSFSCSPTMTPTTPTAPTIPAASQSQASASSENDDLTETRTLSSQPNEREEEEEEEEGAEEDPIMKLISARSSEETLLQLKISSGSSGKGDELSSSGGSITYSVADMDREEILLSDNEANNNEQEPTTAKVEGSDDPALDAEPKTEEPLNASANASLSVHAFSLDTTWPVPRILAQTFWFPHAHGIIYIVDATRKNDPRGIDHLLNARQFLASLIADPHFKRKDIPVVVFANKAGLDPETCYRVDEIAEILGCEEWDIGGAGSDSEGKNGRMNSGEASPTKATAGKGGLVEGGLVKVDASGAVKTRPWCVKSTRCDGAGEGLRESVEWLKSRMGETWRP